MNRIDRCYYDHWQSKLTPVPPVTVPPPKLRPILMLPPPPSRVDKAACKTSTWTYKSGALSVIPKGQRIKPDRSPRRNVQRLQWRNSRWQRGFDGSYGDYDTRISSMTIADVSPKLAVKRIIMLFENYQYREAANFITRLSHGTFKVILTELPIEVFIDSMPHSLPVLEALYAKVFLSDGLNFSIKFLRPESVIMQMVKFFAQQDETLSGVSDIRWEFCGPFICSCKKLLKVIILSDPKIRKLLNARCKSLSKAIESLGQHGMVGTSDENLLSLHDALKVEFEKSATAFKGALQKLEELALANKNATNRTVSHGPAPIQASHQRQLSLHQEEIQDRLIKNKSLLNVVEPILENGELDVLLGILQRRIDYDKEVLFQFTQLRKEAKDVHPNAVVAPILMKYKHGCEQVLQLMKEVSEEEDGDSSDISGYHSDSDSAIMTSGNSPYVSKMARYNFLTRSVRERGRAPLRPSILISGNLSTSSGPTSGLGSSTGPGSTTASSDTHSSEDKTSPAPSPPPLPETPPQLNKPRLSRAKHIELKAKREVLKQNSNSSISSDSSHNSLLCGNCRRHVDDYQPGVTGDVTTIRVDHPPEPPPLPPPPPPPPPQQSTTVTTIPATSIQVPPAPVASEIQAELQSLRRQLNHEKTRVAMLQEKEKKLRERLSEQAQKTLDSTSTKFEDLNLGDKRPTAMLNRYGNLYAQSRVDALDALDALPELENSDELKNKLLFSVIVLAFRSVAGNVTQMKETLRRVLQVPSPSSDDHRHEVAAARELDGSINVFLRKTVDSYDLSRNVDEVCSQIWATLFDYPSLKKCEGLIHYIKDCVRVAWGLYHQNPPFVIEYETRTYHRDMHVRFHTSIQESTHIQTYLWPALLEGEGGVCVQKGVVIT